MRLAFVLLQITATPTASSTVNCSQHLATLTTSTVRPDLTCYIDKLPPHTVLCALIVQLGYYDQRFKFLLQLHPPSSSIQAYTV